MPAAIPDRYRLEVRLGRDSDIEEWLATDISLDRPVLVRSLGPESSRERRRHFVASVGGAAKATHAHLAKVFTVAEVDGGAYSVSEWTGGASVADRVAASNPIDLPDFLPNATGLAGALAALHAVGATHGRIDTSAISYSGAHAAKLGSFGRAPGSDANTDVRALSGALETALTGEPPGGPPPSERVDGVPKAIDAILRAGQSGDLTASELEKALRAAPTPRAPVSDSGPTSRRLLIAAVALVILAVGLVTAGFFLSGGTAPIVPPPTTAAGSTTTMGPEVTTTVPPGAVLSSSPSSYDPFGEGGENDQLVENLIDGDVGSSWATERYLDPIQLLKPGVGVTVRMIGTPTRLDIVGMSPGSTFELYWAATVADVPAGWQRIATAVSRPGPTSLVLPPREGGHWLLWLTELSIADDGSHQTSIAELRFLP